jgi:hypothetical protein
MTFVIIAAVLLFVIESYSRPRCESTTTLDLTSLVGRRK